jgi:hypothetical protein
MGTAIEAYGLTAGGRQAQHAAVPDYDDRQ